MKLELKMNLARRNLERLWDQTYPDEYLEYWGETYVLMRRLKVLPPVPFYHFLENPKRWEELYF